MFISGRDIDMLAQKLAPQWGRGGMQTGYGLGGIFRNLGRTFSPILEEVGGIGVSVGSNLLGNLVQDILGGKSSRASVKARGKQAGINARDLAAQRAVQLALQKALQKGRGIGHFWGRKPKARPKTPPNLKRKAVLGKIGNVIKPILKEAKGIVPNVGVNLLGDVIQDVLAGESVESSIKTHGKEATATAADMATKRALQEIKGTRTRSKSKPAAKRKRAKSTKRKGQGGSGMKKRARSRSKPPAKRKRTQTGGAKKRAKSVKKRGKKRGKPESKDIFTKQRGGLGDYRWW